MKLTVDANVLFACLIKDGHTRRLWFNPEFRLFAPEFIIREFLKYRTMLEKKADCNPTDFNLLLQTALSQLQLIPDKELKPFLPAVASLSNDPKDWLYLSCALKEDTEIWSNDAGFKKQSRIKTKTTTELMKQAGML